MDTTTNANPPEKEHASTLFVKEDLKKQIEGIEKWLEEWRREYHALSQKYAARGQQLIEKDKEITSLRTRVLDLSAYDQRCFEQSSEMIRERDREIERLKSMLFKVIEKL